MAWFGDNFRDNLKNITGQLSNYAKDVISEGTEEISDHQTELRMAQRKIIELETQIEAHKTEVDRLKTLNTELEEKAESSELQINSISNQYRGIIHQKESEIKQLKQKHNAMQDLQEDMLNNASLSTSTSTSMLSPSNISNDDQDFEDVISSQFEINRLRHELQRIQAECDHWKQRASNVDDQQTTFQVGGEPIDLDGNEVGTLKKQMKDLEKRLVNEIDEHQRELSTLQDVHSQKVTLLSKRHKQDLEDYHMRIEELESQLYSGDEASEPPESPRRSFDELRKLRTQSNELESNLQQSQRKVSQLEKANQKLKRDLDIAQKAEAEKENKVQTLQEERDALVEDSQNLKQDKQKLVKEFQNLLEEHKTLTGELEKANLLIDKQNEELDHLKNTDVKALSEQLETQAELQEAQRETEKVRADLLSTKQRLLVQLDTNHTNACEMRQEIEEARKKFAQGVKQQSSKLLHEKQELVNKMIEIGEQVSGSKTAVASLEAVRAQISDQTSDIVTSIGSNEHQEITAEIMNSIESENALLQDQIVKLHAVVKELESANKSLKEERRSSEALVAKLKSKLEKGGVVHSDSDRTLEYTDDSETESLARAADVESNGTQTEESSTEMNRQLPVKPVSQVPINDVDSDRDYLPGGVSDFSSESDRTRQSGFMDTSSVASFDGEFDDSAVFAEIKTKHPEAAVVLKSQFEHFEIVKADWDMEKQALEDVLLKLRNQLKEKERTVQSLTAHNALLEMEIRKSECLKTSQIEDFQEEIEVLQCKIIQYEKDMEAFILDKDDAARELKQLTDKVEEKEKLFLNIKAEKEELNLKLQELEDVHQKTVSELSNTEGKLTEMSDMHRREVEEIIAKMKESEEQKKELVHELDVLKDELSNENQEVGKLQKMKSELEEKVRELQRDMDDKVTMRQESEELQRKESENNDELLQRVQMLEGELHSAKETIKTHDSVKDRMTNQFLELRTQLEETMEANDEKDDQLNELNDQLEAMETKILKLVSERESASSHKEDIMEKFTLELQSMEETIADMQEQMVMLKKENDFLTAELKLSQTRLSQQAKEYEDNIKQLTVNKDRPYQNDVKEEDWSELEQLKARCEELELDARDTKDALSSAVENQQQLTDMLREKEEDIKTLAEESAFYQKLVEDNKEKVACVDELLQKLKDAEAELEQSREQCDTLNEELTTLKEESQSESPETRTLEIITDLESEINVLKKDVEAKVKEISSKTKEIDELNERLHEQSNSIEELNRENLQNSELISEHKNTISVFQEQSVRKDEQIFMLSQKVQNLSDELNSKNSLAPGQGLTEMQDQNSHVEENLSDEEKEKYEQLISKKDEEMAALKEQNLSLTNLLQGNNSSFDQNHPSVNMHQLDQKIKTVEAERNQMMSVLNEKTRECSNLKNEVHRLMKAVSEGSAALNKLQEDNKELSKKLEGPNNDMHKEAMQKLARIIHDKDLEIEAQGQKMESLLSVLQQMQPGESPNIDGILHSNAEMQKQNSMLQAERDQLIVSLTQKHQESVGYYEEVQRLLGAVAATREQYKELQQQYNEALAGQTEKEVETTTDGPMVNQLTEKYNGLQEQYHQLNNDFLTQENKHTELQESYDTLLKSLDEKEVTLDTMKKKMLEMQESLARLEASREELLTKADEVEIEKSAKEHLQQLLEEKEVTIKHLEGEQSRLIAQAETNLQMERESLQGSENTNMVDDRVLEAKEAEIKSLRKQMEFQAKNINNKDDLIKKYTDENLSLKQSLSQNARTLQEKERTLKNKLEELHEKNDILKSRTEEVTSLKSKLDLQNKNIQEKDNLIQGRTEELNALKKHMDAHEKSKLESDDFMKKSREEMNSLKEHIERQNSLLLEKDNLVRSKVDELNKTIDQVRVKERENATLKQQNESWLLHVRGMEGEMNALKQGQQERDQNLQIRTQEMQKLQETVGRLSSAVQEKDFEISALRERSQTLTNLVQEKEQGSQGEMQRIMKQTEAMQQQAQLFQQERDQAIMAYNQKHMEVEALQQEMQKLLEKEQKLSREVERLRHHLLQVEESYTKEALLSEDREKELRNKLAAAEEKAYSSAVQSANQQVSKQVESLQEELHALASQRDQAVLQSVAAQEQAQQYATQLANLQSVLEQFQQETETMYATEMERYQRDARENKEKADSLQKLNTDLQTRLSAATEALDSASRLTEQMDKKDETIRKLKDEVSKKEEEIDEVQVKLRNVIENGGSKVDKPLVKNLFIGYFTTPKGKQTEVLQLISRVLTFSNQEMEKVGLIHPQSSWIPGWLRSPAPTTPPASPSRSKAGDESFTKSFVSFLQHESTPNALVKMPVDQIMMETPKSTRPSFNPFTAPPISPASPMLDHRSGGDTVPHILMKPVQATLPTFTPMPVVEGGRSGSGSIASSRASTPVSSGNALKEILQQ
ncbi:thyroid receptor-interacting protein 11-like isoform X2 [Ptychodera flava]|uniref:thyroid receptor-interacting protein 11-like isoform X2 n=1 Tax=Ptychodera flava TaxID=63121 RepID=UPI00396A5FE1